MNEDWEKALQYARRYLALEGRENAGRLRVGLLAAGILLNMDRNEAAHTELRSFLQKTDDSHSGSDSKLIRPKAAMLHCLSTKTKRWLLW